jgi:hypothetical protein
MTFETTGGFTLRTGEQVLVTPTGKVVGSTYSPTQTMTPMPKKKGIIPFGLATQFGFGKTPFGDQLLTGTMPIGNPAGILPTVVGQVGKGGKWVWSGGKWVWKVTSMGKKTVRGLLKDYMLTQGTLFGTGLAVGLGYLSWNPIGSYFRGKETGESIKEGDVPDLPTTPTPPTPTPTPTPPPSQSTPLEQPPPTVIIQSDGQPTPQVNISGGGGGQGVSESFWLWLIALLGLSGALAFLGIKRRKKSKKKKKKKRRINRKS